MNSRSHIDLIDLGRKLIGHRSVIINSVLINVALPFAFHFAITPSLPVVVNNSYWLQYLVVLCAVLALNFANLVLFNRDQSRFRWVHLSLIILNGLSFLILAFISFSVLLLYAKLFITYLL